MAAFRSEIKGMKELRDKIGRYNKSLAVDVDTVLSQGAMDIAAKARELAPEGFKGTLKNSISANIGDHDSKSISADAYYAAYVEFGTGSRVFQNNRGFTFSQEMKEFAKQFYVNGKGREPARPFMFPALEEGKVNIIKNIKKLFGL